MLSGTFHDLISHSYHNCCSVLLLWEREKERELTGLEEKAVSVTWLNFWLISALRVHKCKMGDMLFNMVPGSRTKPAVVKPWCRCLSCAAIGLIFMGLVPYIGCLLTATINMYKFNFWSYLWMQVPQSCRLNSVFFNYILVLFFFFIFSFIISQ